MEETKELKAEEIVINKNEVAISETKTLTPNELATQMGLVMPKNFIDTIANTFSNYEKNGQLTFPADYNVANAMKSAYLTLQNTKDKSGHSFLDVCSKQSIATALLDMVTQGLNVSSKQAYFIVRGDELTLMRSYFGSQLTLKRIHGIENVWANIIYKDDVIEETIVNGERIIAKHTTNFGNEDNEVIGAYAIISFKNGEKKYTIMTKKEIDACWNKSSSQSRTVHKEFPQEMAKRTVLNRACKNYINTTVSNDSYIEAFNRTTENEYKEAEPTLIKDVREIDI